MSALRFFTYPVAVVTEVQTLGEKRLFYSIQRDMWAGNMIYRLNCLDKLLLLLLLLIT